MSGKNLSEAFVADRAREAFNVNYVNLSAFSMLVYDALLSLDDEITLVWRKRLSFINCVYIASKYLAFVDGILVLSFLFDNNLQSSKCLTLYSTATYFIIAGILLAEIVLLMRTCALWGLSRHVLWYLIVVDLGAATLAIVKLRTSFHSNKLTFVPSPIPSIRSCFPLFNNNVTDDIYIDFVCVMAVELNVLLLTLWRGVMHWKRSTSPLIRIFYRDGAVYLASILGISTINVVFFVTQSSNFYWNMMLEPQRIIHAILSAHLILNVRKLRESGGSDGVSVSSDASPTPQPAQSVSFEMKTMASSLASRNEAEV